MRYNQLETEIEVLSLMHSIGSLGPISLDTETTDLNPRSCDLLKIVLSWDGESAVSIPARFLPLMQGLKNAALLYLQNFKYDYNVLYQHGLDLIDVPFIDTAALHHLIDENAEHSLDAMVRHYYQDNYKEIFWSKYKIYEEAPLDEALEYECKDAIYTYRLAKHFLSELKDRMPLVEHVHRLAKALYLTEIRGVRVDLPLMLKTQEEMGARIQTYLPALRKEFAEYCDTWELEKWLVEMDKRKTPKGKSKVPRPEFNFASNSQVQWLLYRAMKMPVLARTDKGNPSTDYDTIEKLLPDYPQLRTYKDYIEIKTIFGTFVEGLISRVEEGRIYPSFNSNPKEGYGSTVTGRITHSNPNLGNMPKDGPYRNFFLPDEGCLIYGADYSQLEVIIEANLTGDRNLAKIILEGASKHDITAQSLGIPRDLAKTLNFAAGYHCSKYKFKKLLGCSDSEAEYQYNKYWETYKGCRDLKMLTDAEVDAGKPIVNMFGRVRHFPKVFEKDWMVDAAKRQAYNFKIQGPGGEFTNRAFYLVSERLEKSSRGRALWSVHDEVIANCRRAYVQEEIEELVRIMVRLGDEVGLKIPLAAKSYGPLERWAKT